MIYGKVFLGSLCEANNTHPKYVSGYKLTQEGYKYCKKLFSKLLAKDQKDYNTIKNQKQAAGISESGDVGFVKQNANLFRISSLDNESISTKRKYCFALKIDRGPYLSMADSGALGFKGNNKYYLYTYTTKKRLKVATPYYIIDHYDMSDELRYKWNLYKDLDLWSNYFRLGNLYRNKDKYANDNLQELYVYLYRLKLDINKYLNRSLFKKDKNKTLQSYIDKGFDAIIDPEDWVGGFAYPLIILNPEDSLELSKVETIQARPTTIRESADLDFNYKAYDINSTVGRSYIMKDNYTKKYIDYLSENTGEIYVDTDNNKMIGYIFVGKNKDKGFISTLEVAKSYRGLGFGKRLLLDAVKKYDAIDLVVYKDNKIALNLYKKCGFVIIGEAKNNKAWWMKLKSKLTKEDKNRVIKESANQLSPDK